MTFGRREDSKDGKGEGLAIRIGPRSRKGDFIFYKRKSDGGLIKIKGNLCRRQNETSLRFIVPCYFFRYLHIAGPIRCGNFP